MYWKSNIFFLAVLNICKTYSIYVIFSDSTKTASRNPWLNFLWEFSKCSRVFNITRNNIQYFGTKISQRFLSRNLQISLAATKNLFVKTVTYAVSFTDQLSIDITHAHEVWPFHDGFLKVLIIHSAWFGQTTLFFKGACLFKTSRKTFSKGAYSSTDSAENLFWRSQLKSSSLKSLKNSCMI